MDLLELENFENIASTLTKYDSCNARLLFFAVSDDLTGLDLKKEFANFVNGEGIIEFTFFSHQHESKNYRVKFARIKGFDIDVKKAFDDFKVYAKEFVDEFSKKIGIPIILNEEISNN